MKSLPGNDQTQQHDGLAEHPTKNMTARYPWWFRPDKFVFFFILPVFFFVPLINSIYQSRFTTAAANYLDGPMIALGAALLLILATAALMLRGAVPYNATIPNPVAVDHELPNSFLSASFYVTLLGYLVWYLPAITHLDLVLAVFKGTPGAVYRVRSTFSTIPGITTLTQVGIVYSCLYSARVFHGAHLQKRFHYFMATLIGLALFRSILWSERLALIEVAVPLAMGACVYFYQVRGKLSTSIRLAPYLSILALILVFGLFEYRRSWINFYVNFYDSYPDFVLERVFGYYYTALNNGAGLIREIGLDNSGPVYTLQWLYKMPLVGEVVRDLIGASSQGSFFLNYFATPEFNNMSGLYTVWYDWGVGAIVIFAAYGIGAMLMFRLYTLRPSSLLAAHYPVIFYSLFEILRINYLFSARLFPVLAFGLLLAMFRPHRFLRRDDDVPEGNYNSID